MTEGPANLIKSYWFRKPDRIFLHTVFPNGHCSTAKTGGFFQRSYFSPSPAPTYCTANGTKILV